MNEEYIINPTADVRIIKTKACPVCGQEYTDIIQTICPICYLKFLEKINPNLLFQKCCKRFGK